MTTPSFDLGLRFIVEPSGTFLTEEEKKALQQLRPAGIMVRKRNFRDDLPYAEWLREFTQLRASCIEAIGRPTPIISIDHEGGRVVRPPLPITRFPYASRWRDASSRVGSAHGKELRSLGVNLSFAPVVDIHSNPQNPVIHQRAFGRTSDEVIRYALPYLHALAGEGLITCAKHFPGHGDTSVDSHWGLPSLSSTKEELSAREFLPFRAAIREGVPMVMTAHILVPAVDSVAATFSQVFLTTILREELGFTGVVVADALGMHAVRGDLGEEQMIARAVDAELDLFLVVGDNVSITTALQMKELLERVVSKKNCDVAALARSQKRIEALLQQCTITSPYSLSPALLREHEKLAETLAEKSEWDLVVPGFE